MCVFSTPKPPAPPPPPPPPKEAPRPADPATKAARQTMQKQLSQQQGRKSTILTGARFYLSEATTEKKTLLGS